MWSRRTSSDHVACSKLIWSSVRMSEKNKDPLAHSTSETRVCSLILQIISKLVIWLVPFIAFCACFLTSSSGIQLLHGTQKVSRTKILDFYGYSPTDQAQTYQAAFFAAKFKSPCLSIMRFMRSWFEHWNGLVGALLTRALFDLNCAVKLQ